MTTDSLSRSVFDNPPQIYTTIWISSWWRVRWRRNVRSLRWFGSLGASAHISKHQRLQQSSTSSLAETWVAAESTWSEQRWASIECFPTKAVFHVSISRFLCLRCCTIDCGRRLMLDFSQAGISISETLQMIYWIWSTVTTSMNTHTTVWGVCLHINAYLPKIILQVDISR